METIITCDMCGLTQRVDELEPTFMAGCCRCSSILVKRKINSLARTAAFSLAALVLYVPANIYPILRMNYSGAYSEGTVGDGSLTWVGGGRWMVAVFGFSA